MPAPLISIILLNYKSAQDTLACLQSLQKIVYPYYRIIIVDNNSPDNSLQKISDYLETQFSHELIIFDSPEKAMKSKFQKKYTILETGYNGGYAYGNNIGIKYALKNGADYVLILNNDTVVDPGFLEPLVYMCEGDESIGIAASQIFFYDKPDVFWFNGGTFNKRTGKLNHIDYGEKNRGQRALEKTTFITGCLWFIPKHVFEDVGLIKEEYFMYLEDVEFSKRLLDKGYTLKISDDSHIWHKVDSRPYGELTKFSVYWRTRNWLLFMVKNMKPLHWFFGFYNGVVKFSIISVITLRPDLLKAQCRGVMGFLSEIVKHRKS